MNDNTERDPRLFAIPDTHGHAKGEHKPYLEERPLPLTARMLFLWFYHACRRGYPRFLMVADHMNYLTFEDPAAVNLVRRALKLAQAGDLYGAAETANVDVAHAAVVSEGLRRGMRYSIGAEVDNDPRSRPDAQNIVEAMRPDGIVRSVHFIPITHPVHGENWQWPFDNPEFRELHDIVGAEQTWEIYVAALIDAIERLPGHIVGHFFVPAAFGHWPDDAKLSEYEDRVLAAADARGMAIEFNTRFLYRDHTDEEKDRYLAANKRLLRKARDRGVQIAIGSDAHSPRDQGGCFEIVLDVLDELEINELVFPMGGALRRVALRVVREPEPVPPPAPPPAPAEAAETPAAAAKPVRKARPKASAARAPETSPERVPERAETAHDAGAAPSPPAAPAAGDAPAAPHAAEDATGDARPPAETPAPKPRRPRPAASAPPAPEAPAHDDVASVKPPAVAKPQPPAKAPPKVPATATPAPAPAASAKAPANAATAKQPAKAALPPPKPAPAKSPAKKPPAPAKKAASRPVAKASASHRKTSGASKAPAPARTAAKTAAKRAPASSAKPARSKTAAAKSAPARPAAKPARAKKAAPAKKSAAKKAAPARAAAKRAAPKKAAKKPASGRGASARKAAAPKKTSAKKSATKRR